MRYFWFGMTSYICTLVCIQKMYPNLHIFAFVFIATLEGFRHYVYELRMALSSKSLATFALTISVKRVCENCIRFEKCAPMFDFSFFVSLLLLLMFFRFRFGDFSKRKCKK